MTFHRAKIGYKLPDKEAEMSEFPSDKDLSLLGITLSDIEDVKYSHYYPGDPYTELGVARSGHEAMGSFSADMLLRKGLHAVTSRILYQDVKAHPPIGVPHWNQQTRVMRDDWTEPVFHNEPIEHHQIPKSDYIDVIQEVQGEKTKIALKWKDQAVQ